MKLYFMPGACSLASHITAREAGLPVDLVRVDGKAKTYGEGADFNAKNPKGHVPALELDGGEVLTEGPAIMQYLADQKPECKLAPKNGTWERYRLQETLGFLNSEIHKTYSPLFNPAITPEARADRTAYLQKRYGIIEKQLEGKSYLFGDDFSVADAYLFTVTRWSAFLNIDLSAFPNLAAFQARVGERPAVKAAIGAETGGKLPFARGTRRVCRDAARTRPARLARCSRDATSSRRLGYVVPGAPPISRGLPRSVLGAR